MSDTKTETQAQDGTLDDATLTQLDALKTDDKVGPLAKAIGSLAGMVTTLLKKGGAKAEPDDDEDDDDPDDESDDEPDEDDDDEEPSRMRKSVPAYPYDEPAIDLDADAFKADLIKSLGKGERETQKMLKSIAARLDKIEAAQTKIEATQAQQLAAQTESLTLQKSLDQDLAALGRRPRQQDLKKGGAAYDVAAPSGDGLTRAQIEDKLTKAVVAGRMSPLQGQTAVQTLKNTGTLPEPLLKSLSDL